VDSDYRRDVEANGGTLRSALSNAFFANFSPEGQLIYKATAFVDGEGKLGKWDLEAHLLLLTKCFGGC
jgi:hypothetical protein